MRITPNPATASEKPFEGWGTSLVWFANATGDYPEDVRQDLFDAVFGDVLPTTTRDERDTYSSTGLPDDWYRENRPPHHDR